MPKTKPKRAQMPSIDEVLEVFGWAQPPALAQLLDSCRRRSKAIAYRAGNVLRSPQCSTIAEAARSLGTTTARVR